jgi:uncharacterized protein YqgC (DUF456 family)
MSTELLGQGFVLFATLFVMMIGLIFTVVPPLPGTVIIWAAAIVYGLALGWENLGWWTFAILTFLMLVGIIADALGGQFGARFGGASCLSIVVGTVLGFSLGILASLVGTPIVGCVVGVLGVLGGILLVERIRHRDWSTAVDATKGYVAGTAAGIAAKVTAGVIMFVVFLARVYFGL